MKLNEYNILMAKRNRIISDNRSRRMRGLPLLRVPSVPQKPLVPVAYTKSGDYHGRLSDANELPTGYILKWEKARY